MRNLAKDDVPYVDEPKGYKAPSHLKHSDVVVCYVGACSTKKPYSSVQGLQQPQCVCKDQEHQSRSVSAAAHGILDSF